VAPWYRHAVATEPSTAPDEAAVDGRHLRRDRNRDAVIEALLVLFREGNLEPSTDEIAARSGVSARSLFRYFDDVDDLCRAAISQQQHDVAHLFTVAATPDLPTATKVTALVRQRVDLFEAIQHVATVVRLRAPFQPIVRDNLTRNRSVLRDHLATLFAPELASMPDAVAASRLAAADVAASFESWWLWRDDQGLTTKKAAAVLTDTLLVLFTTPEERR